jgi:CHAD domain-containing protein
MHYQIKQFRALEDEVRRIALVEIRRAAHAARPHHMRVDAVHTIRLQCKKLRALLRLVRTGLGRQYAVENRAFRDIARKLARSRDTHVVRTTIDALAAVPTDDGHGQIDHTELLEGLKERLEARNGRQEQAALFAEVRSSLAAIERRAGRWRVRGNPTRILSKGLGATYARARRHFMRARETRKSAAFHEWRKQVKYHGFQLKLMQPISSKTFPGRMKRMTELSRTLGELHDLDVLESWLVPDARASTHRRRLERRLGRKRAELQQMALALGEAQFTRRPHEITDKILKRLDHASSR